MPSGLLSSLSKISTFIIMISSIFSVTISSLSLVVSLTAVVLAEQGGMKQNKTRSYKFSIFLMFYFNFKIFMFLVHSEILDTGFKML